MATPTRAQTITLPPPTGGMNFIDPLAAMPETDSPWLLNVDCENQFIKVRNGYQPFCDVGTGSILALGVYGNISNPATYKIYAYVDEAAGVHNIYDITSGTASLAEALDDDDATQVQAINIFGRLAFSVDQDYVQCGRIFDGSTWSDWGFTYSAVAIGGKVVTTFKSRVYIFNGTSMYYGGVSAVSGAMSGLDIASIFEGKGDIAWAAPLTSPGNRPEELYLAIGNQAGEILVYAGDYPADPNWRIIGRFQVSPPANYNSVLAYNNDVYITTITGIVSLRGLFTSQEPEVIYVSHKINPYFNRYFSENFINLFSGGSVFVPELNKIFFLTHLFFDRPGGSLAPYSAAFGTFFVYNVTSKSWSIHRSDEMGALGLMKGAVYYNRSLYIPNLDTVWTLDTTSFADDAAVIPYQIESAWQSFGSINMNKRLLGIEPILKTDFTGSDVTFKATSDFGRKTSQPASVSLLDGYNIPYYSVGVEGTYLQWRLEGNSTVASEDGLELYSIGVIIQPGGVR